MKPLAERLNDRLEQERRHSWNGGEPSSLPASRTHTSASDLEVEALVALAKRWQSSPHLQADPDFALQLERHLLVRQATLPRKYPRGRWFFPRLWHAHPTLGIALGCCLLLLLLGTAMLVAAAQVSNPDNPLYAVKRWEQGVQVSLARSPESRADLDVQFARDRLSTLASLADPAHAEAYRQALADFEQHMNDAANSIGAIPAGADHDRLSSELVTLKADARRTLRSFLLRLALAELLVTTDVLGQVGDTVPRLLGVEIVLSVHPNAQATISITGVNIQPGAQLLVNEQATGVQGMFQHGVYVFTTNWNGNQHAQSIGILNPDGTAAQTTAITMKSSSGNGNGNSGNGNTGGHGNGNTGGKPSLTPTPHPDPTPRPHPDPTPPPHPDPTPPPHPY